MHPLVPALSLLLPALALAQQKPPTPKELDQWLGTFLAADDKTAAGHSERQAILERVRAVPALDKSQLVQWQGKIQKLWKKGRTIEKAGDNWYWPADKKAGTQERGRYIVGGETKKPKGLAIAMHGGGVGSGDAGGAADGFQAALSKLGWVMIAPQVLETTECGWTDSGTEEFVLDLVSAGLRTWSIDPDHVYFVGHSMGGYGSWALGAHHADRVAAVAPCAGAPTPIRSKPGGPIVRASTTRRSRRRRISLP